MNKDPLWDDFKKAEKASKNTCCRMCFQAKKSLMDLIHIYAKGKYLGTVRLNYCPHCGRKLEE